MSAVRTDTKEIGQVAQHFTGSEENQEAAEKQSKRGRQGTCLMCEVMYIDSNV